MIKNNHVYIYTYEKIFYEKIGYSKLYLPKFRNVMMFYNKNNVNKIWLIS